MSIHHVAIMTSDLDVSLRFWRDGLGLTEFMKGTFTGDWPALFGARSEQLQSIFLGDPATPSAGIVELVQMDGMQAAAAPDTGLAHGFFLVSMEREVEPTLADLARLGFDDGVRRISVPAPGERTVEMAVITAPDGVRLELIGPAQRRDGEQ